MFYNSLCNVLCLMFENKPISIHFCLSLSLESSILYDEMSFPGMRHNTNYSVNFLGFVCNLLTHVQGVKMSKSV